MLTVLGIFSYGGVCEGTLDCILGELSYASQHKLDTAYHRISGDALISRSRSRALGKFMESKADVMVMVDHDIQWRPGDAAHIAKVAVEKGALVGGLYCKRAIGKGWSSRVPVSGAIEFGTPGLIETPALATGFLAIPRTVVERIDDLLDVNGEKWQAAFKDAIEAKEYKLVSELQDASVAPIADGAYRTVDFKYKDYFRCIRATGMAPGIYQFLSEDWSFSVRAVFCGLKSYISTYPLLTHIGDYSYRIPDGMDATDKGIANGENGNVGPVDGQNQGAGGDPGIVRNELSPPAGD